MRPSATVIIGGMEENGQDGTDTTAPPPEPFPI